MKSYKPLLWLLCFPVLHLIIDSLLVRFYDGAWLATPLRFFFETSYLGLLPIMMLGYLPDTGFTNSIATNLLIVANVIVIWACCGRLFYVGWQVLSSIKWLRSFVVLGLMIGYGFALWWIEQPQPDSAIISIDVTQPIGDMPNHHRGFSQGGEGQMMQVGYFENGMQQLGALNPRYIRIDHVYDYYNVYQLQDGEIVHDWTELDRIINAILDIGAEPLISLSYTPQLLADKTVYSKPTDLSAWEDLVYETVHYYNVERDLGITYWEVWNEPNLSHFWDDSREDYYELYDVTARAVKRADESAKVGGLALLFDSPPFLGRAAAFFSLNNGHWDEKL